LISFYFQSDEYTWSGDVIFHALSHGMYAIPNCYFPLRNVDVSSLYNYPEAKFSDPSFSYNPGIGSSTIYYSTDGGSAFKGLKAGEEIFIDYGNNYFSSREGSKFDITTFQEDYIVADNLLHRFRNVANFATHRIDLCIAADKQFVENNFWKSIQPTIQDFSHWRNVDELSLPILNPNNTFVFDFYELTKSVITIWPTRVQGALPSEVSMLIIVFSKGSMKSALLIIVNVVKK
jgi:hypothetical protein